MNGTDTFLDINNAHLRVNSGNVQASTFVLDQINIVTSANTNSTVNFNNVTKAFNAASNIEVGTANLFVDTTTSNVGIGTDAPAYTLDVRGTANVGNLYTTSNVGINTNSPQQTLHINGGTLIGGHVLPTQNEQFDLGSAEAKIRHLFLSDNSLWLGDETRVSFTGGKMKFRQRKKNVLPRGLVTIGANAGHNEAATLTGALSHANAHSGVSGVENMKLEHWLAYAKSLDANKEITDVFTDDAGEYEATSVSDAFKEVGDDIFSAHNVAIGKTTAPTTALDVAGTVTATSFSGGGSALTALNAANIASGTLPVSRGGTGTTSSTGSGALVLQNAPSFTGDVTFDTNTLKIDANNNRMGIGESSPAELLHIRGTGPHMLIEGASNENGKIDFSSGPSYRNRRHQIESVHYALSGNGYRNWLAFNVNEGGESTPSTRMVIRGDGRVGCGTTSPEYKFDVRNGSGDAITTFQVRTAGEIYIGRNHSLSPYISTSMSSARPGINLSSDGGTWRIRKFSANLDFDWQGATKGYLLSSGSGQMNFTGQHRTFIKDTPFTEAENLEGLIVSADNNKYIKMSGGIETGLNAITTNESLPVVSLSTKVKDKKCFGVISASEDPEKREDSFGNFVSVSEKENGDTRVYINSVGEGAIWVSNIGGSLESGDYITTSTVKGYGQKQDSDSLKNYTVAKITMDCDFDPVTQPVQVIKKDEDGENILDDHGQIQWEDHPTETEKAYKIRYLDADGVETDEASAVHKAAFVGCTYHCG